MITRLIRTMRVLGGVCDPGIMVYVLAGASMGIFWSLYSILHVVFSYFSLSYPLNWIALPFDFLKSRDWILLIGMLFSSMETIISFAALAGMVGVGVKLVFGRGKAPCIVQLVYSLVVMVLWLVGRYVLHAIDVLSPSFQYAFFNALTLELMTFIVAYGLILIFRKLAMLFISREKVDGMTVAGILACGYIALIEHYTTYRLLSFQRLESTKDILIYITLFLGALVVILVLYNSAKSLLCRPFQTFERNTNIETVIAASCKYSFVLYCVVYILLGLFLVIPSQGGEKKLRDAQGSPNVILISIDALRPDHLSCYGYPLPTSPHIDALALESSLFTNAISVSPYTLGSVPCMMTSLYPGQIGMGEQDLLALSHSNTTLAELLQREGYETAAFVGNYFLRKKFNVWQGFYIYDDAFSSRELQRGIPEEIAEHLTAKTIDWLKSVHQTKFFLWLHYQDTHGPYTPPSPFDRKFKRSQYPHGNSLTLLEDNSGFGGIPRYQIVNEERDPNYYLSQYDGEINYTDYHIGLLVAELKKLGQYDNTVIIITADHGEAMVGEGGYYFCHGETVREEIIKIPLIIKLPGVGEAKRISTQVSSLDITPTILDLASIPMTDSIMGESLVGLIEEGRYHKQYVYSHKVSLDSVSRAIRSNEYKLVLRGDALELYNLTSDPMERENIYYQDNMQEVAKTLKKELNNHIQQIKAISPLYKQTTVDERTKTMLKALGYVD